MKTRSFSPTLRRITVFLIFLFLVGLSPSNAHAQSNGPIYIVQEGDTLYIIAQRFGTTIDAIAAVNNITDPSVIVPGTELIIPGYEDVAGTLDFHEVQFVFCRYLCTFDRIHRIIWLKRFWQRF